jgi:hypothetical protein
MDAEDFEKRFSADLMVSGLMDRPGTPTPLLFDAKPETLAQLIFGLSDALANIVQALIRADAIDPRSLTKDLQSLIKFWAIDRANSARAMAATCMVDVIREALGDPRPPSPHARPPGSVESWTWKPSTPPRCTG